MAKRKNSPMLVVARSNLVTVITCHGCVVECCAEGDSIAKAFESLPCSTEQIERSVDECEEVR